MNDKVGVDLMSDDFEIFNQTDVESYLADELDMTKSDTKVVIDALWSFIHTEVEKGNTVRFQGVGRFYLSDRGERPARNMYTGEDIIIGEHKALRFSPSRTYAKRLRKRTQAKQDT